MVVISCSSNAAPCVTYPNWCCVSPASNITVPYKVTQQHPHVGIVLVGDVNQMNDRCIHSFPLKQLVKSATRKNVYPADLCYVPTFGAVWASVQSAADDPTIFGSVSSVSVQSVNAPTNQSHLLQPAM